MIGFVLRIGSFVWGVRDLQRAVEFWSAALDFELREAPNDDWAVLVPHDRSGLQFALQVVNSDRARRHHLDLYADDQDGEAQRLVGLGATRVLDWDYEDDADYIVLTDPDGNRFCVVQRAG
jgi:catechol 2,3-dioxygenase-like lactoylglutathione lyase family enzyme